MCAGNFQQIPQNQPCGSTIGKMPDLLVNPQPCHGLLVKAVYKWD